MARLRAWKFFSVWMVLVLVVGLGAALAPASPVAANGVPATIEVSQPVQLTTNPKFDRNPSFFKANDGVWWVFFARGRGDPVPGYNPDTDYYDICYIKSTDNGATWTEGALPSIPGGHGLGAFSPAGFQALDGKIWVFYAANGVGIFYFTSTDNGGSWGGPTAVPNVGGYTVGNHMDAICANDGKVWVFYHGGPGSAIYTRNFGGTDWSSPTLVDDILTYTATPRALQQADGTFRVVYIAGDPLGIYLASSADGTAWSSSMIINTVDDDYDPVLVKDGTMWRLFFAPYIPANDHQWLMTSSSTDLSTWSTPVRVTAGSYGANKWWDFWPEAVTVSPELVLFYASMKDGTQKGDGEIYMFRADWNLANNHYEAIQPAINAASAGDTINVAAGMYDIASTIVLNKGISISGPAGGGAKLQGTNPTAISIFEITASNVTLSNLEITHNALPAFDPLTYNELVVALIRIPTGTGLSGIAITGNTIYVPAQSGLMSTWNGVAITVGAGTTTGISITGNTIHNTRNGVDVQYGNTATVSNNIIYDTKGGIMNYTNSQADADKRTVSGNQWGTTHNEWDIVWNTASYVPDYQQSVLGMSLSNNGAYVLDRRGAVPANLTGNRSHIFVDAASGFDTAHPARGNFNEPFSSISLGVDAVVPGGTINVAAGIYNEPQLSINKGLTLQGAGQGDVIIQRSSGSSYFLSVSGAIDFIMRELTIGASGSATTNFVAHISGLNSATFENVTVIGQGKDYTTDGGAYYYILPSDTNVVGGLDLINVTSASLKNVIVSDVSRNGFSFTNVNSISLDSFAATDCGHSASTGWAGLALYGGTSALTLAGTNSISNAPIGVNVYPNVALPATGSIGISGAGIPVAAPNTTNSDIFAQNVTGTPYKVYATSGPTAGFAGYYSTTGDAIAAALAAKAQFGVEHVVYDLADPKFIVGAGMSIQAAIDAASAGGIINVAVGTYDEQVVINNKSLTLQGAGDATIIKPSSAAKLTEHHSISWAGGTKEIAGIVMANEAGAGSVTVKNLKVDGETVIACPAGAHWVAGIFYRETGGLVDNVAVTNMTIGNTGTGVRSYGIYVYAADSLVSTEIKGSRISNYDKNGINAQGQKLTANIHHNTVTGRGPLPDGDEVQNGVLIIDNATGTVNNNTILNNAYEPAAWGATGIVFVNAGGSAQGNTLTDNQMCAAAQILSGFGSGTSWTVSFSGNIVNALGLSVPGITGLNAATYVDGVTLNVTMDDNQLTGGPGDGISIGDLEGLGPAGSVVATINNNTISSWQHGIHLVSSVAAGSTITGNTITNNVSTTSGIHIEAAVNAANVSANFNDIVGNQTYGVDNQGAGNLNATNNWWGSANGPEHSGNTFNVGSQGDKVTDNVDYVPWLNAAYPAGASFAPVNNTTQGTKFSSIQAAINAASAGDTINVAAGTYNVANSWDGKCCIYINKDLTLSGAGSGSTILDAKHTYSCVNGPPCGPHCTVVWNEAPNVTIEGMTVKDGDYGIRNTNLYEHEVSLDTLVFEDVVVTDNRGHGFVFECDVNTVTMTYCAGNENGDRGIYFCPNKTATTVTLTNTSANDNKHIGFNCQGSINNLSISGGTFNNNAGGKTNYDCDTQEGPFYGFGMELVNCVGTIDGVTAQDNGQDAEAPAEKGAGINIKGASSDVNITYSTLAGNPIGLWLENWDGNQPSPAAVAINNSNVAGNADFGVNNGCTGVTVDATNNWWGANNGPGVIGLGSGDKVSANVDYDPWLRRGSDVAPTTGIGAVTFEVDAGGITGLTAVAEGTLPAAGKPSGVAFLYGLFSFNIIGITPGSTVTVTITYFSATPVGTQYWKCQGDFWVNCTSLLGDDDGDNVLTLTLTDGGLGDADGLANGTIVDPGGPCVGGGGGFGGGGGGGGSPVAAVAYSATLTANMQGNIATVRMTEDGVLGEALVAKDAAGKYRLEIDKGAKVMLAGDVVPLLLRFRGASTTPPTPGNTVIVGPVYEFNAYASKSATTPSPITISPPARLILTYEPDELPQNASEVFIAYYDTEKGWLALAPVPGVVAEIDKAYGMVSHFTPFAVLARTTGPAPAKFRVGVLTVTPSQAKLNQEVNISVNVANTGGTSGSYSLELKVNGISESTKQVTVAAGASQTVDFTITEAQPGTYTVDIAGQKGTFVVMGASTTLNAGLLAIMIAAALILATVVVLLLAFRRRAQ